MFKDRGVVRILVVNIATIDKKEIDKKEISDAESKISIWLNRKNTSTNMNEIVRPWVCARCVSSLSRSALRRAIVNPGLRRYTTKPHTQDGRPFRMAVIGSGPAGFYTAYKVMSRIENSVVDMYEQLPVPFGLVRFGVAPDHPEVKVSLPHGYQRAWS